MERIHIQIDSAQTKETDKHFKYTLEHIESGRTAKLEGYGQIHGTYHAATIAAITAALSRFTRPCEIEIIADDDFVLTMMTKNLARWALAGYTTTKGKDVANKELWERLWPLYMKHNITTRKDG